MSDNSGKFTYAHGGIIRGPRDEKRLALIFTGGDFGEGTGVVLDALATHGIKGSFFFTGDYLEKPEYHPFVQRIVEEGHYIGPHSHKHLLYCPWDDREVTLVTCEEFKADLEKNLEELSGFGRTREQMRYWIPPYEWYNSQIAQWSDEMGMILFNFTPGTLSHADYTEDDAKNYRDNKTIFESILKHESENLDGLNGFLLLSHVGASPKRSEKFYNRLDELISVLEERGYAFARVDELLK